MRASDFDYHLPLDRIAQVPAERRDAARLYVLPRAGGEAAHATVADLPALLAARFPDGALLVGNDTRVIPARLYGRKPSGGRVELLLLSRLAVEESAGAWRETWTCMAGASKPIRPGLVVALDGERPPRAEVMAVRGAEADVVFSSDEPGGLLAAAERIGRVPLPPYIERDAASPSSPSSPSSIDRERYQTVYARVPGAAAAPTAGLHLTPPLLDELARRGIEFATLTLHVGLGTFAPLRTDDVDGLDELHAERFDLPAATAARIAAARKSGRPILAVGTTTVRALESAAARRDATGDGDGPVAPGAGETRLFIKPGHRFRAVDGLLTNFHLPKSTLMMLVAAFLDGHAAPTGSGRERLLHAYADAVARGYRFFSYGDAMLIA